MLNPPLDDDEQWRVGEFDRLYRKVRCALPDDIDFPDDAVHQAIGEALDSYQSGGPMPDAETIADRLRATENED